MPSSAAQRQIMLSAAVMFGIFGIAAVIFRQTGIYDDALPVLAGVAAWGFLALVAVIVVRDRFLGADPRKEYRHFLGHHPEVLGRVGRPMGFSDDAGELPRGSGPAQINLGVEIVGPEGSARAELAMARLGRRWEVLSAALEESGQRVVLRGESPAA